MPSLEDKLRSLGVSLGSPAPTNRPLTQPGAGARASSLDAALAGGWLTTTHGAAYLIETLYSNGYTNIREAGLTSSALHNLAAWASEPALPNIDLESIAFIDTETTGLSGGTGTYAFLVGIGRFKGEQFHLEQYFLPDPGGEAAQLIAIENSLAACQALVSFNGKAFDIPLLNTRFILQGWVPPYKGYAHVDLLHIARRLWRDRLPSRTLINLEVQILGASRTEEDIPGWMIPQMYFDYLRSGDALPLKHVIYHNAMDIVSLAALFIYIARMLDDPMQADLSNGLDILALGRLFESLGYTDLAVQLYVRGLEHDDMHNDATPRQVYLDAIQRLARIHRRQDHYAEAIQLWELAASQRHLEAHIELAKFFEHILREVDPAIDWTRAAIALVQSSDFTSIERHRLLQELEHRLNRLLRKAAA